MKTPALIATIGQHLPGSHAPRPTETDETSQPAEPTDVAPEHFDIDKHHGSGQGLMKYNGPADGMSHPSHLKTVRAAISGLLPLMYRVRVQGAENIPSEGAQVFAYDHPSTVDPLMIVHLVGRDVRSMATKGLFYGPAGPIVTAGGAFPVDRSNPQPVSMQHSIDLLQHGIPVSIAPSGTTNHEEETLPPFKLGPANMAVKGQAESVVPITEYYHPADGTEGTSKEKAAGWIGAAILAGGTIAAAVAGGPVAIVVGTAAAAVAGGYAAGKAAGHLAHAPFSMQAYVKLAARLGGGLLGAAAVGTGVAVTAAACPAAAPILLVAAGVVGGAAVVGLARGWQHRDVADVIVCEPINVQDEVEKYGPDQVVPKLTEDIHTRMGHAKARLSGVPYDEDAPKIAPSRKKAAPPA